MARQILVGRKGESSARLIPFLTLPDSEALLSLSCSVPKVLQGLLSLCGEYFWLQVQWNPSFELTQGWMAQPRSFARLQGSFLLQTLSSGSPFSVEQPDFSPPVRIVAARWLFLLRCRPPGCLTSSDFHRQLSPVEFFSRGRCLAAPGCSRRRGSLCSWQ